MSRAVVDASILIKLAIPEPDSMLAEQVIGTLTHILAPDLVWAEMTSVIHKRVRGRMLTITQARRLIAGIKQIPIRTAPSSELFEAAFDLAMATGSTIYDALYLAMALKHDAPLISADIRLINAVNGSRITIKACLPADWPK